MEQGVTPPTIDLNRTTHRQVLPELLALIQPVNFQKAAELSAKEFPKRKHVTIVTVEEVIKIAKENSFGIARKNDSFFLYNGQFWQMLDDDDLMDFLSKAAEKMGVDRFDARHYRFQEELFRQFMRSAHLERPAVEGVTLVNLQNGTLEMNGMPRIRPHDEADFLTYQLPYEYDPTATAPMFMKYLDEVLPDRSAQGVIAEFLGYVFIKISVLKLEKALLLFGSGANGKSVFFDIVRALLGDANLCSYSLSSLTNESGYYRADIGHRLLNYASEINSNLEAARFKALVSGEPIEARKPYCQPFILEDYARLCFNVNELPRDIEHTHAFFRRFLIIPFSVTISEERQDKELAQKIIVSELPGIFNWLVEGLQRVLTQRRFSACDAADRELENFRRQSDTVQLFMEESGYRRHPVDIKPLKSLYQDYREFCSEDGYKCVNKKNMSKRLEAIGYTIERRGVGQVVFCSNE